jgi:hypothetical protein
MRSTPLRWFGRAALLGAVTLAGCRSSRVPVVAQPPVTAGERAAFEREVVVKIFRPDGQTPAGFAARSGVKTRAADFFVRHAAIFGLRAGVDALEPGAPLPVAFGSAARDRFFQQYFRGVPVASEGYRVSEDAEGNLLSAIGHVLRGINTSVTPAITAEQAILQQQAQAGVPPAQRSARRVVSKLVLDPQGTREDPAQIRLIWRVHHEQESEGLFSDLDAASGTLLFSQPRAIH